MNLYAIANSVITSVNKNTEALLKVSTGYTTTPDGTQVPQYIVQPKVIQAQNMSVEDLKHLGFINQQGQFLSVYAEGMIPAIRRGMELGTSIIVTIPYGEVDPVEWQVKAVLECYEDHWVRVLIQNTGKKSLHDKRYFGFQGTGMQPFDQGVLAP